MTSLYMLTGHPTNWAVLVNKIITSIPKMFSKLNIVKAQWLSGRVLDSRPKGRGFEPYQRHCAVSLSKNINPSLVLDQPRKTRPFITERLLMGRKESNQTNKQTCSNMISMEALTDLKLVLLYDCHQSPSLIG